jgi:hypothetical protein
VGFLSIEEDRGAQREGEREAEDVRRDHELEVQNRHARRSVGRHLGQVG